MNPTLPTNPVSIPEFRYFLTARFLITLAIQIQAVILGWQIYEMTRDPLSLGLSGLAEAIPAISIALVAGYIADHQIRHRIVMIGYSVLLLSSVGFVIYSIPSVREAAGNSVLPLYLIVGLTGLARGLTAPAMFGLLAEIVPQQLLGRAAAWSTTIWQLAAVGGPALAGFIFLILHFTGSYLLVAGSILCGFSAILFIRSKPKPVQSGEESLFTGLTAGLKFVWNKDVLIAAISLDLFAVLFGGAVALLPIFADDILKVGPEGLGILRAAPAIGSAIVALIMAKYPPGRGAGRWLLVCVAGFGLTMIGFAFSTWFWLSVALLVISGIFDGVSVVIRATIMQVYTPTSMKGRVSAINSIFIGSSNEIGAFESGVAARLLGLIPSVVFGGMMTLIVVGVTAVKAKKLRKLDL